MTPGEQALMNAFIIGIVFAILGLWVIHEQNKPRKK